MKIIIICLLASMGAGLSTAFVGLSAAVFITPMLTAFLDVPFYDAVGIALASDVLASAVSAVTYYKNGNMDLKRGKPLMIAVWITAVLGSVVAFFLSSEEWGNTALGYWSVIGAFIVGLDLAIRAGKNNRSAPSEYTGRRKTAIILCGSYIGFVCGFQGTGGGIMLLMTLTLIMSFEYKTAVGTSVLIMSLTALIGSVSHFVINGLPDIKILVLTIAATTFFARIGAVIAAKLPAVKLKRATGIFLTVSSIALFILKLAGNS